MPFFLVWGLQYPDSTITTGPFITHHQNNHYLPEILAIFVEAFFDSLIVPFTE
jgi:hypothetical protein